MWFLVVISCKLEVNIERSPSSIYQIVPLIGRLLLRLVNLHEWQLQEMNGRIGELAVSSQKIRKHVLEDFVWQRSLSWFMTFAGGVKASPVTERLKVSIRECKEAIFFTAHMAVAEIYPGFYRKRRWWVFFALPKDPRWKVDDYIL